MRNKIIAGVATALLVGTFMGTSALGCPIGWPWLCRLSVTGRRQPCDTPGVPSTAESQVWGPSRRESIMTSTTTSLLKAAADAQTVLLAIVDQEPNIPLDELYRRAEEQTQVDESALRTAIWDLISDRELIIRSGNLLQRAS